MKRASALENCAYCGGPTDVKDDDNLWWLPVEGSDRFEVAHFLCGRLMRGRAALRAYQQAYGEEIGFNDDALVIDLLTDLRLVMNELGHEYNGVDAIAEWHQANIVEEYMP